MVLTLLQHRNQAGVTYLLEKVVYPLPLREGSPISHPQDPTERGLLSPSPQVKVLSPAGTSEVEGKVGGPSTGQIMTAKKEETI